VLDDFQRAESRDCPMSSCAAPAGSPCRTAKGKAAVQYHTARFRLEPSLAKVLNVPTPGVRKPGATWTELPRPAAAGSEPAGHVRIGYARASTLRQSLDTQLDSLKGAGVTRILHEKISTRAVQRPELDKAAGLARELLASGVAVTLVVHERLGRGIDLATLAEELKAAGVGLEFLTGESQGSHDPSGVVFTVLAALSGMEREYIRDRTLEGHESASKRGKTIGGAAVTDQHMLSMALHRHGQDLSLRDIAARLVITTGRKKGQHPPRPPSCACSANTTSRRPPERRDLPSATHRDVQGINYYTRLLFLWSYGPEWRASTGVESTTHTSSLHAEVSVARSRVTLRSSRAALRSRLL
jgi:DNA invertase Pin-like site-specific DNA recombinase